MDDDHFAQRIEEGVASWWAAATTLEMTRTSIVTSMQHEATHIQILYAEMQEMRAQLHALQREVHQMRSSFYVAGSALSRDLAAQCDLGGPSPSGGGRGDATGGRGDATGGPSPSGGGSDEHDPELVRVLCFISGVAQQFLERAGMDAGVASLLHEPWEIPQPLRRSLRRFIPVARFR